LEVSGTASVATVTKSTDKRVIDTSAAEDKAEAAKDRREKLKDELDRYHEINEIISDTERELDKLGKAKDRAFGANKLALMDKEIAK
jgi:multidrug resistance efflux pump